MRRRLALPHPRRRAALRVVAVTGWLEATLDLQIIDNAATKALNSSTRRFERIGTTVVPGFRLYIRL